MTATVRPGRLLVVCTGNVCRSPYVHLLLDDLLHRAGQAGVEVASAGTRAVNGAPVAGRIDKALRRRDVTGARGFAARRMVPDDLDRVDMVLTASREHRSVVVRMQPRLHTRVFTLLQVQRLLQDAGPPPRASAGLNPVAVLAQHCSQVRGMSPSGLHEDDVPDPWGGSARVYREAIGLMTPAVESLAAALTLR